MVEAAGSRRAAVAGPVVGAVSLALVGVALAYGVVRVARPDTLFQYTEGPVLGSLAALLERGSTAALYPVDGWTEPPLVLTLYPPLFFWFSAGVHRLLGEPATLVAPRLLALAAAAVVLAALARVAARRGLPWTWAALPIGAVAIAPPFFNLVGGAQVDLPALALALGGVLLLLPEDPHPRGAAREAGALLLFLLAAGVKQSFLAAPLAVGVARAATGRARDGLRFVGVFAALALTGAVLLERVTGGGFSAHALGGLRGAAGGEGVRLALVRSAPWLWGPLVLLVVLAAGRRLRPGLPEAYAALTWLLHLAGLARAGASVNYLAEPLVAVALLGLVRAPAPRAGEALPAGGAAPAWLVGALAVWLVAAGALRGAERGVGVARAAVADEPFTLVGWRGGHPLAVAELFPAILEAGGRPYLNDPFAFGVLLDAGRWDAGRLAADLRAGRVPFVLPHVDPGLGPAPPGARARELMFAYLWLAPPVWGAIAEGYEPAGEGPRRVWLPRARGGAAREEER